MFVATRSIACFRQRDASLQITPTLTGDEGMVPPPSRTYDVTDVAVWQPFCAGAARATGGQSVPPAHDSSSADPESNPVMQPGDFGRGLVYSITSTRSY
jgi:hypothetical protein